MAAIKTFGFHFRKPSLRIRTWESRDARTSWRLVHIQVGWVEFWFHPWVGLEDLFYPLLAVLAVLGIIVSVWRGTYGNNIGSGPGGAGSVEGLLATHPAASCARCSGLTGSPSNPSF